MDSPRAGPLGNLSRDQHRRDDLVRVRRGDLPPAGMPVAIRPITTAEYGAPAARPSYSVLDTAAYHRLGGPAMPDWKAALAEYFAEWRELQSEN